MAIWARNCKCGSERAATQGNNGEWRRRRRGCTATNGEVGFLRRWGDVSGWRGGISCGGDHAALGYSATHFFQTQRFCLSIFLATLPRLLWPLSLHYSIPFFLGISLISLPLFFHSKTIQFSVKSLILMMMSYNWITHLVF